MCLREEKGNVQNEDADQTNQSNTDHYAHWRRQGGGGAGGGNDFGSVQTGPDL